MNDESYMTDFRADCTDTTIAVRGVTLHWQNVNYLVASAGVRDNTAFATTEPDNAELVRIISAAIADDPLHNPNFNKIQEQLNGIRNQSAEPICL
ncbi:MAG: hypothetical protein KF851_04130 [Pirellulaceae bacterium]|nr:hypothetical protein [Pirellulaceae bacterium]